MKLDHRHRDLFLKKFTVEIHQSVPKVEENEDTGEKNPVFEEENPVYDDQLLGIALLDLSDWYYHLI